MDGAVEISGERVLLREFRADDFEAVHSWAEDPEVVRYMPWGPNAPDDTRAFLQRAAGLAGAEPRVGWELAVVLPSSSDRPVGGVGLHRDGSNAMLGYCYHRDAWGKGVATAAARLMLRFGFEEVGVHRVWAGCDPDNAASAAVLRKLGMRLEGHLVEECRVDGAWRDTLVFALLKHEWRAASG